jgi:arsenate reductase-like glutaredoxin family protein
MPRDITIQIIGTHKSSDTRKAMRFFRERGIRPHLVDLNERPLSRGELENLARSIGAEELIDAEGKEFQRRGLAYMVYDPLEELARTPLLLKMPIVRCGREATVGLDTKTWSRWLAG